MLSPPVQAMRIEEKFGQSEIDERRMKRLFEDWEAQLTQANLQDPDDGFITVDEA